MVLGDGEVVHSKAPLRRRFPVPPDPLPMFNTALLGGFLHLLGATCEELLCQGTGK